MTGVLYGVGVGPGDPELITYQAARIMREADVIAIPGSGGDGERVALTIAGQHIGDKPVIELDMPMTRDQALLKQKHDEAAQIIGGYLQGGKSVAFLTLGDPSIYSTYAYVHKRILAMGLEARLIPGVPSFCAVAARLNQSLCEGAEPLHIIPASYEGAFDGMEWKGTKVLMKSGKRFAAVKEYLEETGQAENVSMVERCGMENERIYRHLQDVQDVPGYFCILVVKEKGGEG